MATPRVAYDMVGRSDVLVIDTPGWTDAQTMKMAKWSTFCVIPSRANRMDDLRETVHLLHALKKEGIEEWRFGVALNALRDACAVEDDRDARAYLAEAGYKALPGFVRDLKAYEVALLQGKAITETEEETANGEAFALVDGIAGAVFEAGKRLASKSKQQNEPQLKAAREKESGRGGRGR